MCFDVLLLLFVEVGYLVHLLHLLYLPSLCLLNLLGHVRQPSPLLCKLLLQLVLESTLLVQTLSVLGLLTSHSLVGLDLLRLLGSLVRDLSPQVVYASLVVSACIRLIDLNLILFADHVLGLELHQLAIEFALIDLLASGSLALGVSVLLDLLCSSQACLAGPASLGLGR